MAEAQRRKLKPRSGVWEHFTRVADGHGNETDMVQCNRCRSPLNAAYGTSSLKKHVERCIGQGRQRRKLKPRSGVWEHFTRVTDDHGNETDIVQCNRCRSPLNAAYGTSSLNKHVKLCIGQEAAVAGASQPPLPQLLPPCAPSGSGTSMDSEPSLDEARKDLARMIALRGYDPSIVDDDCFKSFVNTLSPGFKFPSHSLIEETCDSIFDEERRDLWSRLLRSKGKVSLALGTAKTLDREIMYLACHFFIDDEWKLRKLVTQAYVVVDDLLNFNSPVLGGQVVSNDRKESTIKAIAEYLDFCGFSKRLFMVAYEKDKQNICRPLRHVAFDITCTTTYVDTWLHDIAQCLLPKREWDIEGQTWRGSEFINMTRQKRQKLISDLGLDDPWMYHDQNWYALYCSLEFLPKERFDATDLPQELLCKVFGKIYRAIQRISDSSYPTSNLCLKELFDVWNVLRSELARATGDRADTYRKYEEFFGSSVADVLREASKTLKKAIDDSYEVWSIPLALDPRHKLEHIPSIFETIYGPEVAASYISKVETRLMKMYADYSSSRVAERELRHYLEGKPVHDPGQAFDILNWWKENSCKYPRVARMARDALAMPTCSNPSSEDIAHVRSIIRGYSK